MYYLYRLTFKEVIQEKKHSLDFILYCIRNSENGSEFNHFMELTPEIGKIIKKIPIDYSEEWESCIVRKPGFANTYYSNQELEHKNFNQQKFGNMMCRSYKIAAELFKENYPTNEIVDFLRKRRQIIGITAGQEFEVVDRYGRERTEMYMDTSLRNEYLAVKIETLKKMKEGKFSSEFFKFNEGSFEDLSNAKILFFTDLEGEKIPIHQLFFSSYGEEMLSILGATSFDYFRHSSIDSMNKIMKHVNNLVQKVRDSNDKKEILDLLSQIFFWTCHAKPYSLGEPAIAETIIRAIWESKGFKSLPPWKEGIIPWVAAVTHINVEDFVREFPDLFDGEIL